MPLLKDLLTIAEHAHQGDFVLQLSSGVTDTRLPIARAGWNHLQQATAPGAYHLEMKDNEGGEPARGDSSSMTCEPGSRHLPLRSADAGGWGEAGVRMENPAAVGASMKNLWTRTRNLFSCPPLGQVTRKMGHGALV